MLLLKQCIYLYFPLRSIVIFVVVAIFVVISVVVAVLVSMLLFIVISICHLIYCTAVYTINSFSHCTFSNKFVCTISCYSRLRTNTIVLFGNSYIFSRDPHYGGDHSHFPCRLLNPL